MSIYSLMAFASRIFVISTCSETALVNSTSVVLFNRDFNWARICSPVFPVAQIRKMNPCRSKYCRESVRMLSSVVSFDFAASACSCLLHLPCLSFFCPISACELIAAIHSSSGSDAHVRSDAEYNAASLGNGRWWSMDEAYELLAQHECMTAWKVSLVTRFNRFKPLSIWVCVLTIAGSSVFFPTERELLWVGPKFRNIAII